MCLQLNLIRHLCEPPIAANSNLSKNALRLLHSAQLADMEFEVHTYTSSSVKGKDPHAQMSTINLVPQTVVQKVHSFKAHRVIVSARCEWFKKALMSGMQESINRKVVITDTSPVIFRRLLLYIYGAPIDRTVGAEQICELMLLADRFSIDDLKVIYLSALILILWLHKRANFNFLFMLRIYVKILWTPWLMKIPLFVYWVLLIVMWPLCSNQTAFHFFRNILTWQSQICSRNCHKTCRWPISTKVYPNIFFKVLYCSWKLWT